jgi:hypothetical protein
MDSNFTNSPDVAPTGRRAGRRDLLWVALALAAIAVLLILWLMPPLQQPEAPPAEVLRAELVLLEGRLCRMGQTSAFTGLMVDYYPDGALLSRSVVSNGLLHGLSKGWHTNGHVQVTELFRDGVSHGLRAKWHASGAKLSEAEIVAGKFHGLFQRWYENGLLAEHAEFREGHPHGLSLAYFPSGFLKARVRLENGQVAESTFWSDGELRQLPTNDGAGL